MINTSSLGISLGSNRKCCIIWSYRVLKIVNGASLQSSMLNLNSEQVRKTAYSRDNFTLREMTDSQKRELWKRCFEGITLNHIQRSSAENIPDAENGVIEPMVRNIWNRYNQMFGDNSPELTGEQLRAVRHLILLSSHKCQQRCWSFAERLREWVIFSGLDIYGLRGLPDDIREKRCKELLKDFTLVWRTCDAVWLACTVTNKLKTIWRGKFQHSAIIVGIENFISAEERKTL